VEWLGGLDILVVNAGILKQGTIDIFSIEKFGRMLAVNLRGVFAALHFVLPKLNDAGRVIAVGRSSALRAGFPGASVHPAAKAAVAALARGVAVDLARGASP
jgi:3-oxoacyl-[acyl-carrier protein] reductase